MVRKCSVGGCKSGYASMKNEPKVTVYRFPKDLEEKRRWIKSLPNVLSEDKVTRNMCLCALHFPPDVPMKQAGKYQVPAEPPSIFNNVRKSCCGLTPDKPRTTTKCLSSARNVDIDEMAAFKERDHLKSNAFYETIMNKLTPLGLVAWGDENKEFVFMSKTRKGPVPSFSVYFTQLSVPEPAIARIVNIFILMKRYCLQSQTDNKENKQNKKKKVAKLSSKSDLKNCTRTSTRRDYCI